MCEWVGAFSTTTSKTLLIFPHVTCPTDGADGGSVVVVSEQVASKSLLTSGAAGSLDLESVEREVASHRLAALVGGATAGDVHRVQALLEAGALLESRVKVPYIAAGAPAAMGQRAVDAAVKGKHGNIVRELLSWGAWSDTAPLSALLEGVRFVDS